LVGTARARHLYFTSPTLDAQKALELGLVTGVEADGDLEDAVRDLARALDSGPRIALSYIKQTMNLAETASWPKSWRWRRFATPIVVKRKIIVRPRLLLQKSGRLAWRGDRVSAEVMQVMARKRLEIQRRRVYNGS